ncbi:hypothetical protein [Paenibacillus sp. FSL H7-0714]|uniref:hypothetical protein n=1 Tax=Paenibacillus sp. FSL H7-0714 TaxID=2954735 RepID=UPI0030FB473E
MRRAAGLLFLLFTLTACGSSSGLSTDDLAIVKVNDEKQIVRYGMSRETAEKVLGEAEYDSKFILSYENGVDILFRDNSVVVIRLDEESSGVYKTLQGAEINMNKKDLKGIYGKDTAIEVSENNLDYLYDSINKKYLKTMEVSSKQRDKYYHVSIGFNDRGEAESIFLMDNNAAVLME